MRAAVIMGGRSSEHEVSLRSGASVAAGVRAAGHEVLEVVIERDGRWISEGEALTVSPGDGLLGADVAFPVLHGPFGEDGTVQGLLECLDIPYVGPSVLAAAITIDKITFKRVLAGAGIPQVAFCAVGDDGWRDAVETMGLPLWVKPSRLGSSVGITKVEHLDGLDEAVEGALRHDPRVIIEAHSAGREIECSVIGNDEPTTSVPGEIIAQAEWYDYEAKYSDGGMTLTAPAELPPAVNDLVRARAARIYTLAACTGLARCDFFVTEAGEVLVNELNTIPGFTAQSVFAKLFEASGMPYPELCQRLLDLAIERYERDRQFEY